MTEHDELRDALLAWLTDTYGYAYQDAAVALVDEDVDALLALPEVTALRAAAAESGKRLEALIRVRRDRDTLLCEVAAHRADTKAPARAELAPDTDRAKTPALCPKCDGQGRVSRPPWIPGDQPTWSSPGIHTYPCNLCNGRMILDHD